VEHFSDYKRESEKALTWRLHELAIVGAIIGTSTTARGCQMLFTTYCQTRWILIQNGPKISNLWTIYKKR